MKAIWNDTVLAESNDTIVVEGNHYFPADSLVSAHFKESETHSICAWKGKASYYHVSVDGKTNSDAAWYYPEPKQEAELIKGRIAFWRGVSVIA
ncbi:MAG: DUF427 domain-containing protein [Bacteroidetes bacterium]|nr:DUF427 domain-containing protein [Bacteroidota bacterium]MBL0016339.1 DUF427 domain-containing protein [Bacteroidota bacterium]MBP6638670.1 DUF427 domain-containing protein [Bacteroidia bacterium]MBP6720813.1 DUF427 domain-containing protein [Bacteroidia bacterium]MBP8074223.1 DUF427 domain-containing protein [Bacteroidia bacterium]